MKKYLVLYYSKTGNSKFLAEKVSSQLNGNVRRIKPLITSVVFLFFLTRLKIGIRTYISEAFVRDYDEIILVGPLWGGLISSPVKNALQKCLKAKKPIHFAISCDIPDDEKDHQYGYARSFAQATELGGSFIKTTTAFSNALVKQELAKTNSEIPERILLTEDNFKGDIQGRMQDFLRDVEG